MEVASASSTMPASIQSKDNIKLPKPKKVIHNKRYSLINFFNLFQKSAKTVSPQLIKPPFTPGSIIIEGCEGFTPKIKTVSSHLNDLNNEIIDKNRNSPLTMKVLPKPRVILNLKF